MRKLFSGVVALATAGTAMVALTGTAEARPAADWAGCPSGAVCIYPQNQNPAQSPSNIYWSYGAHNLSNQVGWHWVLNNQTGGASAELCLNYGGTNCNYTIGNPPRGVWADLTPVNSIKLNRP
ncbi:MULTISPECIES: hypothetical protein [Streptomyces]|uniref:Peptidase inhibitor family I36 n=1 Tax=Streptomyces asoensis TaxID=249586 RepID=A0ABQ3RXG4_9ACTN|nr:MULTISPECIES: hypothetical protein [Streptomyces]MBK3632446.1 hypothetical protein [Streptomyces sp. MBT97]GGQ53271.1 hypothetical protein GCM10010496_14740 [Streptomyces asoensis]GHI60565.1 hypothetical protein Saso_22150 [Streptomyces asoensis]